MNRITLSVAAGAILVTTISSYGLHTQLRQQNAALRELESRVEAATPNEMQAATTGDARHTPVAARLDELGQLV